MAVGKIILDRPDYMFAVYGESGEYDDHVEWVVGVFFDKENALNLCELLRRDAIDHGIPIDISESVHGNPPTDLLDEGLMNNWVGYGVEYSSGEIKIMG